MAKRVIALLTRTAVPFQDEDAAAAEAITPGHLIIKNSSGLWIKHNDDAPALAGLVAIAMERDEMGSDIDVAYAIGDTVKAWYPCAGERGTMIIPDAENVALNDLLESDGAGRLQVRTTGAPIAKALEAVNNTSGADARLRVIFL